MTHQEALQKLGELYVNAHGLFTALTANIEADPFGFRSFEALHHEVCQKIEEARSLVICSAYECDKFAWVPPAPAAPVALPTQGEPSPVRLSGV